MKKKLKESERPFPPFTLKRAVAAKKPLKTMHKSWYVPSQAAPSLSHGPADSVIYCTTVHTHIMRMPPLSVSFFSFPVYSFFTPPPSNLPRCHCVRHEKPTDLNRGQQHCVPQENNLLHAARLFPSFDIITAEILYLLLHHHLRHEFLELFSTKEWFTFRLLTFHFCILVYGTYLIFFTTGQLVLTFRLLCATELLISDGSIQHPALSEIIKHIFKFGYNWTVKFEK